MSNRQLAYNVNLQFQLRISIFIAKVYNEIAHRQIPALFIPKDFLCIFNLQEEAKGLQSWDKEEQKAITTYIRTKSGRRIAKTVYVSKKDYEAIKRGEKDANEVLKKYIKTEEGETLEGMGC